MDKYIEYSKSEKKYQAKLDGFYNRCRRAEQPLIQVQLIGPKARLHWDYISLDSKHDTVVLGEQGAAVFAGFRQMVVALGLSADGGKMSVSHMGVGWINDLTHEQARLLAGVLFDLYQLLLLEA